MPTENERKYVLNKDCEDKVKALAKKRYLIEQGYLFSSKGISNRVRRSLSTSGKEKYYMTFKFTTPAGRVVEIEKSLSKRDFLDLWGASMNKLEKVRYEICIPEVWEIDFFKDHNSETYFALAEHEMPEEQIEPRVIPDIVKSNLLFVVPLTDCRFSSKLLADTRYAQSMYQEIQNSQSR